MSALMAKPRTARRPLAVVLSAAVLAVGLAATLIGCPEPFGAFDNPYDCNSPNYQGYPAVEDPADIQPVTVNAPNMPFMPALVALTVHGAVGYLFQVDDDAAFGSPLPDIATAGNVCPPGSWPVLTAGAAWYWRVSARESANDPWGPWSSTQASFSLTAPSVGATTPTEAQAVADTTPALDWGNVAGAAKYRVQLAEDSLFAAVVADDDTLAASAYAVSAVLDNDTNYYWRVASANAAGGWSPWTNVHGFRVDWNPTIDVVSPDDGGFTNDTTPTLDWSDADGAAGFDVRIAETQGGLSSTTVVQVTASTYTILDPPVNGERWWTVTPYDSSAVRGATRGPWSFTVDIGRPTLQSPVDGLATMNARPSFDWSAVDGADLYHIQVATDPTFEMMAVEDATLANPAFQPASNLASGAWYLWRVCAHVGGTWGGWTSSRSFYVGVPAPVLESPADAAELADATPAFEWADAPGVTGWELQLAEDAGFTEGLVDSGSLTGSSWNFNDFLDDQATYFWRVRARGDDGATMGPWSAPWSFTVVLPLPTLLSPANGAVIDDTTPDFDWTDLSGVALYRFQLSTNADFSGTPVTNETPASSAYAQTTVLSMAESYWWRVGVRFTDGTISAFTDPFSFRYSLPVPAAPDLAAEDDSGLSDSDNLTNRTTAITIGGPLPSAGLAVRVYSDLDGLLGETVSAADLSWKVDVTLSSSVLGARTHSITAETVSGSEYSARSPALSVTVDIVPPAGSGPLLKLPRIGDRTSTDKSPLVTWTPCADPVDGYLVEADDDPAFGSPELAAVVAGGSASSYQMPTALPVSTTVPKGTRYWFRVRGIDTAGNAGPTYGPARYAEVGRFMNDFNGDGYSDLVAGAPYHDAMARPDSGQVYVFHGGAAMDTTADVVITGPAGGDNWGRSFASGDFNGDGFADLVINGGNVYLGGTAMDPDVHFTLSVPSGNCYTVACAGDMDADGYDEFVGMSSRIAYLYRGGATPDGTADLTLQPTNGSEFFGFDMDGLGDVNLDGYADFAIGDCGYDGTYYDSGKVYVYMGASSLSADYSFDSGPGLNAAYYLHGHAVSSGGDYNADGATELLIGVPGFGSDKGRTGLYFGVPTGGDFNVGYDYYYTSTMSGDRSGAEVAGGGDLDGDGHDDIVIGCPGFSLNAGRVVIAWGADSAPGATGSTLQESTWGDYFGMLVHFVGDCDADGYDDFAVGAWGRDYNGDDRGSVYLFFGQPEQTAPTKMLEFMGQSAGDQMGYRTSTIGG